METMNVKVSVVIPTYNRAELLKKAVASLQKQTYRNMEIIIVDDCSSDNTAAIVEEINDSRIIYIKHHKNKGGAEARNTAIKYASGDYIAFLDSDDQWLPEKLARQMKVFKENSETGLVYTGVKVVDGTRVIKEIVPKYRGGIMSRLIESNCIDTTSSIIVKKDLLLAVGGFNSSLPSCQDWDLYLRLSKIAKFDYVADSMVLFYQHQGSRISTNVESVIKGHLYMYKEYKKTAEKEGGNVLLEFQKNIAKKIFRMGIISGNKSLVKKAREISIGNLYLSPHTLKNLFIYFSTFINLEILLFLYSQTVKSNFKFLKLLKTSPQH